MRHLRRRPGAAFGADVAPSSSACFCGRPFDETLDSPKVDPLHKGHVDFGFDEVERRLAGKPVTDDPAAMAAIAMAQLIDWMIGPGQAFRRHRDRERIGARAIVLAWVLRPDRFTGRPVSLRTLSKFLGIHYNVASAISAATRRRFKVKNPYHAHRGIKTP